MKNAIYYRCYDIFSNPNVYNSIPGGERFSDVFRVFGKNITFVDRSETIKTPIKVHLLDNMKLPKMESFSKTFEEVCDERANSLYKQAKETNRKIVILYSGGIDSSAILCSFIRTRTDEELRNDFIVLMSDYSCQENPNFTNNFVFKKFQCHSSFRNRYFLGNNDYLVVSGENADQLFGSQLNDTFGSFHGYDFLFKDLKSNEGSVISWFGKSIGDQARGEVIYRTLSKITDNAPIDIDNIYKFFWWINFTTKWQSVYVRLLSISHNVDKIRLEQNYTTFYSPKDFQLWCMNNPNEIVPTDKFSNKLTAKQYIYSVTKDSSYNKKLKFGSLSKLFLQKKLPLSLALDGDTLTEVDILNSDYYEYQNDFLEEK